VVENMVGERRRKDGSASARQDDLRELMRGWVPASVVGPRAEPTH
jgi:hypothetical protein